MRLLAPRGQTGDGKARLIEERAVIVKNLVGLTHLRAHLDRARSEPFRQGASVGVWEITLPFFAAALIAIAATGTAHGSGPAGVRAVVARNLEGWARYDADEVASTNAGDAVWQNPFGVRLHGPTQIRTLLISLFARPGYRAANDTHPAHVQAVHMLGADVAVVWSEESSTGQTDNGKPLGDGHSHYLQVLHRTASRRLITDDMTMDERVLP